MDRASRARNQEARKPAFLFPRCPLRAWLATPTYLQDPPTYLSTKPPDEILKHRSSQPGSQSEQQGPAQPAHRASSLTPSRSPWVPGGAVRPHPIYPSSDLSSHAHNPS